MQKTSQPTKPGTPRLSESARFLSAPAGIVSTAWPAVRKTCEQKLGVMFDPWQEGAGRLILGKRADGNLAAMIDGVGMSLPRQVGKTYLISAMVFALCVNTPGLLVIWTAHHLKTSAETFLSLQGFASRQRVAPFVKYVHTGSGDEEIAFHNGSRVLFGARERGFGRGIPGVDVLIFDEGQILSDMALANMLAAMNTSRFGLHLYIGTPPKPEDEGKSESFKRMRSEAKDGTLTDGAWVEFGADPDADLNDHAQWRKANPSYPKRTPMQSLLRLKRKLTPDDWRREGMGIWDEDAGLAPSEIDWIKWDALGHTAAPLDGRIAYAVRFSADGSRVALAAALRPAVGVPHVELIKVRDMAAGTSWLVTWLSARWRGCSRITVDGKAGAGALVNALRVAKIPARIICTPSVDEVIAAHAMTAEAIRSASLTHSSQKQLDDAVRGAGKRTIGPLGGWGWKPLSPDVDVVPLEAVTLALHAVTTGKSGAGRTGSDSRRAVIL